ncbi:MAG: FAD-dependent oxidoreductase [bacterium]
MRKEDAKAAGEEFLVSLLDHCDQWSEQPERQPLPKGRLHPYTRLFSTIQVNGLTLKNRLVMGPMGNINMAEEMGRPSARMIAYFEERARGGVGLITSGLVPISQGIDPTTTEAGDRSLFPRLDRSRTVLDGWRTLAERLHAWGAHFFIQLTPGLGRVGSPEVLLKKWRLPVSSWWNPNFYLPGVPCRPLTDGECRRIIVRTGQAAADAKALGIDGVYLHGHEGYLLEQMTNTAFNRRPWGRYHDWRRFGLELVAEVRRRVGTLYPIMYRIDLSLALRASYGAKMDEIPSLRRFRHERTIAQSLSYLEELVGVGVDMVDADLGGYDNWWLPHPPDSMPAGCYLPVARLVKEHFSSVGVRSQSGHEVPVVAVGKLGDPDLAEEAMRRGDCDLVMLARPLLADPQWPKKAYAGRVAEIRPCIGDQEACLNEFLEGGHPQCSVNPRSGFEDFSRGEDLAPNFHPKRIGVVGAGPAGILCALTAARRGHGVTLWEEADDIGGMMIPASAPRIKTDLRAYLEFLERELNSCSQAHNLAIHLGRKVTPALLEEAGIDILVLATGGVQPAPSFPGCDSPVVLQAVDLLRCPDRIEGGGHVLVVGGGMLGCECAHFLAAERSYRVTLIEGAPHFMIGACTANRGHLLHLLEKTGVQLWNCTQLIRLEGKRAVLLKNISNTVPDPTCTWAPLLPENISNPLAKPLRMQLEEETIIVDWVVLAQGLTSNRSLYQTCLAQRPAPEIHLIGDAFQVGRIFHAVKAGFTVGAAL